MQKVVRSGDTINQVRKMSIEIEGDRRPAVVAEWIGQAVFSP